MGVDAAMGLTMRLLAQAQALAALTAHLRLLDDGRSADPALRSQLDRVVACLQADEAIRDLTPSERAVVVGFARSYLRQALELLEDPARPGAWSHDDPAVLQAQGAASAIIASLFVEAGLGRPDARILDVGTGVASLAVAFCERYSEATVVGLDPWEPSLALARRNIAEAGLGSRITLHPTPIQDYDDDDGFDLVWFPSFFIPASVLDAALRNTRRLLRPGGAVVVGVSDTTDDPLTGAVDDLMTVRSGGTPLVPAEAIERLRRVGFSDARELPRTWQAPVRLVGGALAGSTAPGAGTAAVP